MNGEYWVHGDDDVMRLFRGDRLLGQARQIACNTWSYSTDTEAGSTFGFTLTRDEAMDAITRATRRRRRA